MRSTVRWTLAAAAASLVAAAPAQAQFTQYYGNTGGFVDNSATAAYLAALGGTSQFHLNFNLDKFGNPLGAAGGQISGDIFSTLVTFATIQSANGGVTSSLVNYSGASPSSEIGPQPSWDGILSINFISNGVFATAVGFGGVDVGVGAGIRLYDTNNNLIRSDVSNQADLFGFYGYVGTGAQTIGRVELDGGFYAIQDISFNVTNVTATPEPATLALLAPGLAAVAGLRRFRRRNPSESTDA